MEVLNIIIIAIVAGLCLNFMPCVLPLIAVKILTLLKTNLKYVGIIYSMGSVTSMTLLGTIFIASKQLLWGFQMQNPYFLFSISGIFFILTLSALDFITIPDILNQTLNKIKLQQDYFGAFLNGVLSVVVGSACMAPFLGTAVGGALMFDGLIGVIIFSCVGLGMGLPFILIDFYPNSLKFIPKPGSWMNIVKKLTSIPLLLTSIWFGYLAVQIL